MKKPFVYRGEIFGLKTAGFFGPIKSCWLSRAFEATKIDIVMQEIRAINCKDILVRYVNEQNARWIRDVVANGGHFIKTDDEKLTIVIRKEGKKAVLYLHPCP